MIRLSRSMNSFRNQAAQSAVMRYVGTIWPNLLVQRSLKSFALHQGLVYTIQHISACVRSKYRLIA
jgi:hypothetical protein